MAIIHSENAKSVPVTIGAERLFWRYEFAADNPVNGAYSTQWGVGLFRYVAAAGGFVMICAIDDVAIAALPAPYEKTLAGKRMRLVDEMVRIFNMTLDQLGITAAKPPAGALYADAERQATFEYLVGHVVVNADGRFAKV